MGLIVSKNKYAKEAKEAHQINKKLKMCESKVAYDIEELAFQKNQRTYKCPYCEKWHRSGSLTLLVRTLEKRLKLSKE